MALLRSPYFRLLLAAIVGAAVAVAAIAVFSGSDENGADAERADGDAAAVGGSAGPNTGFERVVDELPLDIGRLEPEQYLAFGGNELVARVDEQRFLCQLGEDERLQAGEAFYGEVAGRMQEADVEDFKVTIAPLRDDLEVVELAVGEDGSVSLTEQGRSDEPC